LTALLIGLTIMCAALAGYLYWRYVWFFRNPPRVPPPGHNLVSPADGTVVYAKAVEPEHEVITIKQGIAAGVSDIVREDLKAPKILIGVFMSPFNVHYNRVPLAGQVDFIRHHRPRYTNHCMGAMHWRTLCRRAPFYKNSPHILSNERTVTKFTGEFNGRSLSYYVVQIAGKSVKGIDSFFGPGDRLGKGKIFGMIRVGSQVDLIVPVMEGMQVRVQPGDKVRAGESILIAQPLDKKKGGKIVKIDLHVHSRYSTRPSQWVLQKLGCQECYTQPHDLYRIAKARGMSWVTITDHNTIQGALEIADLPDTFVSEEVTAYFPEDGCKAHVLVYDIHEAQHREIQKARKNIHDLVAYLRGQGISHSLAHPLWAVNNRLTLEHFEQFLLLFKTFELNGGRDTQLNDWLKTVLTLLTAEDLELLQEKHRVTPLFALPWKKNFTAGSDDHSSLNIARSYTQVKGAGSLPDFWADLNTGKAQPMGKASTPVTLAHNLYSIAYQYYREKYRLDKYANSNVFINFFEKYLLVNLQGNKSLPKYHYLKHKIRNYFTSQKQNEHIFSLICNEANKISPGKANGNPEKQWMQILDEISHNILKQFHRHFRKALLDADLVELVNSTTSSALIYLGLAPYFAAYYSFASDRGLGEKIISTFLAREGDKGEENTAIRMAHFTDTFYEVNGVGLSIRRQVEAANRTKKDYTVITCDRVARPHLKGVRHFDPVGVLHLPEYPEQKLFHPPVLEMLQYCYEQNITHIKTATPGPMGLAALAIARLLRLPIWGTYHTALPQYAQYLTEDNAVYQVMWKYIGWFYNQMDLIFVPSQSIAAELQQHGIEADKMQVFPRGVDLSQFNPSKRNGYLESHFALQDGRKLLYVGRVSKEKNLELLGEVFKSLSQRYRDLHLIVVGDGPYLAQMRQDMAGTLCLFTGYLEGEDLAAVFASCDLFVFPSTTDTFGNVVLEAQASGIPVIVSDSGGPHENVVPGETGFVVPGNDADSLRVAIEALLDDPARLQRMGQAARRYVQERSFENAFQATWKIYEQAAVRLEGRENTCP
jgi:glycosyltransferase involved in cell wall biosynthesis/phosphatidylserine decarboxylase